MRGTDGDAPDDQDSVPPGTRLAWSIDCRGRQRQQLVHWRAGHGPAGQCDGYVRGSSRCATRTCRRGTDTPVRGLKGGGHRSGPPRPGGKALMGPFMQLLGQLVDNSNWTYRRAALLAIAAVAEGTQAEMTKALPAIVRYVRRIRENSRTVKRRRGQPAHAGRGTWKQGRGGAMLPCVHAAASSCSRRTRTRASATPCATASASCATTLCPGCKRCTPTSSCRVCLASCRT